jgi:hypothetical protein
MTGPDDLDVIDDWRNRIDVWMDGLGNGVKRGDIVELDPINAKRYT